MSNFYKTLQETKLSDLDLPSNIAQFLNKSKIFTAYDLHKKLMTVKVMGAEGWPGITQAELDYLLVLVKKISKGEKITSIPLTKSPKIQPSSMKSQSQPTNPKPVQNTSRTPEKSKSYNLPSTPEENSLPMIKNPFIGMHTLKLDSVEGFESITSIEKRLAVQLAKVRLIGEINPPRELVNNLGTQFKQFFTQGSRDEILAIIKVDYPSSFLTFMVGMGIYEYDLQGLWPAILKELGLSSQSGLGQTFEELLDHFGFPRFEKLRDQ